jgi:hypothetical protein
LNGNLNGAYISKAKLNWWHFNIGTDIVNS